MKRGERQGGRHRCRLREGDSVCVCVARGIERENRLKDGLWAHLLSVCILMRHCGNPASQAAVKVTGDYQDHNGAGW